MRVRIIKKLDVLLPPMKYPFLVKSVDFISCLTVRILEAYVRYKFIVWSLESIKQLLKKIISDAYIVDFISCLTARVLEA